MKLVHKLVEEVYLESEVFATPVPHHIVDGGQQLKMQLLLAVSYLHEQTVELVLFLLA